MLAYQFLCQSAEILPRSKEPVDTIEHQLQETQKLVQNHIFSQSPVLSLVIKTPNKFQQA